MGEENNFYLAPWVREYKEEEKAKQTWLLQLAEKYALSVEDSKHPNGHYMNEVIITPLGTSLGTVSPDAMLDNLVSTLREKAAKERKLDREMILHIHKGLLEAAKWLAPLVVAPVAPLLWTIFNSPLVLTPLTALSLYDAGKDVATGNVTWETGLKVLPALDIPRQIGLWDRLAALLGNNASKARTLGRELNTAAKNIKLQESSIFPRLIGWAPKQNVSGFHTSNDAKFVPNFWFENWATKTYNAPKGVYLSATKPTSGFLTERPYTYQMLTTLEKPIIQIGEVLGPTKNGIRNLIERLALSMNADGIIYLGIKDNLIPNQTIIKTLNPDVKLNITSRGPARISLAERMGIPKGERNFVRKWHIANYPGYLLKILMKGSPLEKQLSKTGTISINSILALTNKASNIEKEVVDKVLSEKFAGLKTVDYNLFKKAILDELITSYTLKPLTEYADYGVNRLGYHPKHYLDANADPRLERFTDELGEGFRFREDGRLLGSIDSNEPWWYENYPKLNTFTFEHPRIPTGNNKHYDVSTLGHIRTYTTKDEPNILYVMESLSDWGQSHVKMMPSVLAHLIAIEKALKSGNTHASHSFINRLSSLMSDKLTKYERMAIDNINKELESGQPSGFSTIEDLWNKKYEILKKASNRSDIGILGQHLHDNYLLRQLLETLKYAAENGLTKMRYPTPETAAKIEGYAKQNMYKSPEGKIVTSREALEKSDPNLINDLREDLAELAASLRQLGILPSSNELWVNMESQLRTLESPKIKEGFYSIGLDYPLEHQTILKKYSDFPNLFKKLYKNDNVRIVTDSKGNTWYEVDVPKNYLNLEWQFKQGGKMNILQFLKNGSGIHIKKENRGKFTDYCGGKVTSECISRGKHSSNPAIRKRATFAANARKWKHEDGGKVHQAFVNGVSILDSNTDAYKFVKRKMRKAANGDNTSNWKTWVKNNGQTIGQFIQTGVSNIVSALLKKKAAVLQAKANEVADQVADADDFASNLETAYGLYDNITNYIKSNSTDPINFGDIDRNYFAYQTAWNKTLAASLRRKNQTKLKNADLLAQGNSEINNAILGSVGGAALMALNAYLNRTSNTSTTTPTTNTLVNPLSLSNYDGPLYG